MIIFRLLECKNRKWLVNMSQVILNRPSRCFEISAQYFFITSNIQNRNDHIVLCLAVEVVVEFDYSADQDDELTIKVGDVIKNVDQQEGGWWEGELNGKRGVFPDNFVKVRRYLRTRAFRWELLILYQISPGKGRKEKLGAYARKRVAAGAYPTNALSF